MKRMVAFLLALWLLTTPAMATETDKDDKDAQLYAAGLAAVESCVDDSMSDVEKLTALHDWMCLNCDYGATLRGTTAYGAIVEGRAVCTGYAEGLAYLATLAGLDGVATYSAEMDHAWILATLDGERYFCDCTWDDGKRAKLGLIRHTYWLFDEDNAGKIGHYGWDSLETVPGGTLEQAPWADAMTAVVFEGDWCYYIDGQFCLWRCDRDTWETELLLTVDESWPIPEDEEDSKTELYSGLVLLDDRLYFNTPDKICSVDLDGQDLQTVLTPDTEDGAIYGLALRDGALCYSVADSADALRYEIQEVSLPEDKAVTQQ